MLLKGIYLTLMVGPVLAVPVPFQVTESLTGVEVTSESGRRTAFRLTFTTSNRAPLDTVFLLVAGSLPPVLRVILVVTINGVPEVLVDGVVTQTQLQPGSGSKPSILTVTGEDLSALMEFVDFSGIPYPAMPAEARVALILAKYAEFGIIPLIIPSILPSVPIPTDRIPLHKGKDLDYILKLACDIGYVFYIDPGPAPGTNIAYWGPEIRTGIPQPALNLDMDAETNVESLNFQFQSDQRTLPVLNYQNQETKIPIPIPIPDINPLAPPLGIFEPIPRRVDFIEGTAKMQPEEIIMKGFAYAFRTTDAVVADGSLDVVRYGRVLKSRRLVGVRGGGLAFDGLYFVKKVVHHIKRGEYKQDFQLVRNGLVSTVPVVPA